MKNYSRWEKKTLYVGSSKLVQEKEWEAWEKLTRVEGNFEYHDMVGGGSRKKIDSFGDIEELFGEE